MVLALEVLGLGTCGLGLALALANMALIQSLVAARLPREICKTYRGDVYVMFSYPDISYLSNI